MKIRQLVLPLAVAGAFTLVACDDDPFALRWTADADTVRLFALSLPQANLASAIDFSSRSVVRIEAPTVEGRWDVAVDRRDGEFVWLPAGALGVVSEAAIGVLENETFLGAETAPGDTLKYVRAEALPIRLGEVYAVRTRRSAGAFGSRCSYYGKVEALNLDPSVGAVTFQFDVSPVCNSRELVPPK